MFWSRLFNLSLLTCLLTTVIRASPAWSSQHSSTPPAKLASAVPLLSPASYRDGALFINSMLQAANRLNDYSFRYAMDVFEGKSVNHELARFWFKKPRLIKVIVDEGDNRGAEAVLYPDGKVRAHKGGALKFVVLTLSPDSDMLTAANDCSMVKSDFASLSSHLQQMLKEGIASQVTTLPIAWEDKKVYVLELLEGPVEQKTLLKRICVDSHSLLPVQWQDFKNGKPWSSTIFSDLRNNLGLPDNFFKI